MNKELEAELKGLEHAIRLTFTGMTLEMVRYWLMRRHEELLKGDFEEAANPSVDSARFPDK